MEESKKVNLEPLYEWVVWAKLSSIREVELILLKGHLYLEVALSVVLSRNDLNNDNFSFHKKILTLEKIEFKDKDKINLIIPFLFEINRMRNKLAHEPLFDIRKSELKFWSKNILDNFEGMKYTRYTPTTKIIHSFSVLAKNLLELN